MKTKRRFLIKESLKRKLVSRWFIGINIVLFLLIFITFNINSIITFFGGDFKDKKNVLILDEANVYSKLEKEIIRLSEVSIVEYEVQEVNDNVELLKEKVKNDSNSILLIVKKDSKHYINTTIYTSNGLSFLNQNIISSALNNIRKEIVLKDLGISNEEMKKLEESITLNEITLQEKKINSNKEISSAVTVMLFLVPCFFLITTLVQMIGSEINEEKTTKSMEIIISNVTPKTHLISKIVSCTIFTLIQLSLILLFGLLSSFFSNHGIGVLTNSTSKGFVQSILGELITKDFILMVQSILPILIPSFILTIITYALLAGVLSSMTTNIDDFQQLQTPLMFIISIGFYLSLLAIFFEGSIFIKIMSFIPLISFMLSPTLYLLGQVSLLSVFLSVVLEIVFLILTYYYGIKIYREGLLNYSGDKLWRKILKAIKSN